MQNEKAVLSSGGGQATNNSQQKPRIAWIDWAKGWTIFFVVIFHALGSIHNANVFSREYQYIGEYSMFLIGTFIMPVFFALSGFVYKEVENWNQYKVKMIKRIASLIVPYIIFSFLYVFLQNISPGSSTHAIHHWDSLLRIFIQPISYLWYIYALVAIYLLAGILDMCKMGAKAKIVFSVLLFLIASYITLPPFISLMFTWNITFVMGRLLKKNKNMYQGNWCILSLIVISISWIFQVSFGGSSWYNTNGLTYVTFLSKVSSIIIVFYIYSRLHDNMVNKYFQSCGRDSLIIYLVHAPVVSVIRAILVKLGFLNYPLMLLSVIIIAWMISIFACYLSRKIKLIDFIFYPLRYVNKM